MTESLYRDAYVGIRARLAELTARIQDREGEVTDAFWKALPRQQRARLEDLRKGLELTTASEFETLARAENMLAAYLAELEDLLAMLPSLERDWTTAPDDVIVTPLSHSYGWNVPFENADTSELQDAFVEMVQKRDAEATIHEDGPRSQLARFRDHNAPFALRAVVLSTMGNRTLHAQVGEVGMTLFTSIQRSLPPLLIRHETIVLTVSKALGIKDDVEVGDPSFDGLFLIEGTQEASDLFLTPQVRTPPSHARALRRADPHRRPRVPARVNSMALRTRGKSAGSGDQGAARGATDAPVSAFPQRVEAVAARIRMVGEWSSNRRAFTHEKSTRMGRSIIVEVASCAVCLVS